MNGRAVGRQPVRASPEPLVELWERFWDRHGRMILLVGILIFMGILVSLVLKLVWFGLAHYNLLEFAGLQKSATSLSTARTTATQKASIFSPRHHNYAAPIPTFDWLQDNQSSVIVSVTTVDYAVEDIGDTSDQAPGEDTGDSYVQAALLEQGSLGTPSTGGILDLSNNPPSPIRPIIICGHERHSCTAHGKPEICCPPGYTCHASPSTPSGILCCRDSSSCSTSTLDPPTCPLDLVQCPPSVGGGCCPKAIACSAAGCVEFDGDGRSPAAPASRIVAAVRNTGIAGGLAEGAGRAVLADVLVGDQPRPTATVAKYGEIRTMDKGEEALLEAMWRPFASPAVPLVTGLLVVAGWFARH